MAFQVLAKWTLFKCYSRHWTATKHNQIITVTNWGSWKWLWENSGRLETLLLGSHQTNVWLWWQFILMVHRNRDPITIYRHQHYHHHGWKSYVYKDMWKESFCHRNLNHCEQYIIKWLINLKWMINVELLIAKMGFLSKVSTSSLLKLPSLFAAWLFFYFSY